MILELKKITGTESAWKDLLSYYDQLDPFQVRGSNLFAHRHHYEKSGSVSEEKMRSLLTSFGYLLHKDYLLTRKGRGNMNLLAAYADFCYREDFTPEEKKALYQAYRRNRFGSDPTKPLVRTKLKWLKQAGYKVIQEPVWISPFD